MNITFCRRASHSRALAFLDRAKKPLRKSHDEKRAVRSECSPPVRAAAITITRSPLLKRNSFETDLRQDDLECLDGIRCVITACKDKVIAGGGLRNMN